MSKQTDVFDAMVLEALRQYGRSVSYVIRNRLAMNGAGNYDTPSVLRALKRLHAAGKVRQAPSSYAVMLAWEPAP